MQACEIIKSKMAKQTILYNLEITHLFYKCASYRFLFSTLGATRS